MKKEIKKLGLLLIVFSIIGCASIQKHYNLEQPTGKVISVSIGGTIFRVNKTSDLPNVFGGRDIYGGQVNRGYSQMKLIDIKGSILTLKITEKNQYSSETTMDRYGTRSNISMNTEVSINNNQQDIDSTILNFDTNKQQDIIIGNIQVIFSKVKPYSVEYTLKNINQ